MYNATSFLAWFIWPIIVSKDFYCLFVFSAQMCVYIIFMKLDLYIDIIYIYTYIYLSICIYIRLVQK